MATRTSPGRSRQWSRPGTVHALAGQLPSPPPSSAILVQAAGHGARRRHRRPRRAARPTVAPVAGVRPGRSGWLRPAWRCGFWVAGGRDMWLFRRRRVAALSLFPARPCARPLAVPSDRARRSRGTRRPLLVVPLVVGAPFALVGEEIHAGKAYRAYFTADYVWRRAVVAELAKGDVPPANPFYRTTSCTTTGCPTCRARSSDRTWECVSIDRAAADALGPHRRDVRRCLFGLARWSCRPRGRRGARDGYGFIAHQRRGCRMRCGTIGARRRH